MKTTLQESQAQALKISKKTESLEKQIGRFEANLAHSLGKPGRPARHLLEAKQVAVDRFLKGLKLPLLFSNSALTSLVPRGNVVGVGIGLKMIQGKPSKTMAVRLYVERKLARESVPPALLLPKEIADVPTDVIETGRFRKLPATIPIQQRRLRPARPGCSIGFQLKNQPGILMAGTLGAVVEDDAGRYILSNNHVLANENRLPKNSPIFQPGLLDGGNRARDEVARLTRFVTLQPRQPNAADCAIAQMGDPHSVSPLFLPKMGKLTLGTSVEAREGMRVHKVGRTTGYTQGTVFDVSADVKVEYEIGIIVFQDQMLIRGPQTPFSDAGDSGSVIVDRDSRRPTGLLFAGSASHTVANHLDEVLSQLGVSVVV